MKTRNHNGKHTDRKASRKAVAQPEYSLSQRETRRQQGKALRKDCPRSRHADAVVENTDRDPLALIEASNEDRLPNLLPIRFTRMAESAFAFFRGTAVLQAHDLQDAPSSGLIVQCCGDCHLMNFSGFATPERALVFDINDFDETLPAPFEWDVKRLATSFVLAARWLGFDADGARRSVTAMVAAYRTAMSRFSDLSVLEIWYARTSMDEMFQEFAHDPKVVKLLKRGVEQAAEHTAEHVFHKISKVVDGRPQLADQPPLLFHADPSELDLKRDVMPFFAKYRDSLSRDRQALLDRYEVLDVVHKVVGVGSVGTRCYVVLLAGCQDDHLLLQIKEARRSVLEGRSGSPPFQNNGERIVTGQRLMQSASDIFLGWTGGLHGHDFYVRQLRDMKITPNLTGYSPRILSAYGDLCGRVLARAHAKAGDAPTIAGYVGSTDRFDDAIADYAADYADQVEQDYDAFQEAIRAGRFPIETIPSAMEQAIR
jgi:uncharacterized protein (DUF2252 family)